MNNPLILKINFKKMTVSKHKQLRKPKTKSNKSISKKSKVYDETSPVQKNEFINPIELSIDELDKLLPDYLDLAIFDPDPKIVINALERQKTRNFNKAVDELFKIFSDDAELEQLQSEKKLIEDTEIINNKINNFIVMLFQEIETNNDVSIKVNLKPYPIFLGFLENIVDSKDRYDLILYHNYFADYYSKTLLEITAHYFDNNTVNHYDSSVNNIIKNDYMLMKKLFLTSYESEFFKLLKKYHNFIYDL